MEEEVKLKPKVSLKRKGEAAPFTFNERMQIELVWSSDTDLDLCLFWKTSDGKEGGVFSNEFNQNLKDLGTLKEFPFIEHSGDKKTPRPGGESNEQIKVKSIDAMSELYVVVINYDKAIDQVPVTFSKDSGRVEITTDTGDNYEVPVDDSREGHLYLVCKIENADGEKKAINKGEVLSLGQAFRQIPGFKLICE
jgi:uncharacterized protein involved in tellurium resistance